MADGTRGGSNDGSLPLIATDDAGVAGQVQIVKLAQAADGSATVIDADGSGLKVQLGAALPAGTAAIGKLAANSGVDIGDVDVTSLPALVAGTANIGDVDVLTVPAPLSTTGGGTEATAHRVTIASDSTGVLSVDDNAGSLTVDAADGTIFVRSTASSTFPVQVPATAANPTKAEDAVSANGDAGAAMLAVRKVTPANTSDTDGDYGFLQMSAGRLWASATIDAALPAGTANIGDVDVLTIAAGDNNIGNVDIVTMPNVTLAAGTNTNEVVGDIAHDTGVAGNPVQIAGSAQDMDDTAPPNTVSAESDTTRLAVDRDGALFVRPFGPRIWSYHENSSSALTDTSVHAAPAAGLSLYVTDIVVSTGAATAFNIFFEEGASTVLGPYYLEAIAGRGFAISFATPKKITAATALTVTTSAAIAHAIDVTGFTAQG